MLLGQDLVVGAISLPIDVNVGVCDFGFNFENNAANTYRQTMVNMYGVNVQTCYRALRITDCIQVNAYGSSFENSSIGVLYDYSRTTGTNSSSCNLTNCYFERNGKHVKVTQHGTAISRGISISGCFFESVSTTYISTDAFEDAGSGDYKVDLDGELNSIEACAWSTAPAVADIIVQTGATNNYLGPQNRLAASLTIVDNGTATVNNITPIGASSAATIGGIFRHSVNLRLENAVQLEGLNNAGSAWKDLIQINASDVVTVGAVDVTAQIFASAQPTWFDGATSEFLTTSDGGSGGVASAGAGNKYVELNINGTVYKVLHDGAV